MNDKACSLQICYSATNIATTQVTQVIDTLRAKKHWVFDMDGTLTHAIHDFDAIRAQLNLPAGKPILESIANLPEQEKMGVNQQLDELEYDLASKATAQSHSDELLDLLKKKKCELGIVTRNGHGIAKATLKACGLDTYFSDATIISRDCCAPKPDPDGINLLLERWSAKAQDAVMVGDHWFDLESGKRAGLTTIHLDPKGIFEWPEQTDYAVVSLQSLAALWYESV